MRNGKSSRGGMILNVILILLNLACLLWIILSWRGQQNDKAALDYYRDRGVDVIDFGSMENDGSLRS